MNGWNSVRPGVGVFLTAGSGFSWRLDPDPVQLKLDPNPVQHRLDPYPVQLRLDPEPVQLRLEPDPVQLRLDSDPVQLWLDPDLVQLRLDPDLVQLTRIWIQFSWDWIRNLCRKPLPLPLPGLPALWSITSVDSANRFINHSTNKYCYRWLFRFQL